MAFAIGVLEVGLQDHVLWRLLVVTALIHLVFAVWPLLDIEFSGLFLQADGSFWLANSQFAEDIRMPIWLASVAIAALSVLMLGATLLRRTKAQTSWRLWAFVTSLYVLGPGLLVNALLKQNWGRARPMTVEAFGGDRLFTPPFEIAGQCVNNCSFVSGEAASAAVMALVLAFCFAGDLGKHRKIAVYVALIALFALASGMRVASGRHFLSDVVFAGLFMSILARLLYRAFRVVRPQGNGLVRAILVDLIGVGQASARQSVSPLPISEIDVVSGHSQQ